MSIALGIHSAVLSSEDLEGDSFEEVKEDFLLLL